MKKMLLVAILVCVMLAGCGGKVKNFFCNPTAEQVQAANVGKALAQSALTALAVFTGNPIVVSLAGQAIPTFDKIVAGYCVTQVQWDAAVNAVEDGAVAAATKAYRPVETDKIKYLKAVKWGQ